MRMRVRCQIQRPAEQILITGLLSGDPKIVEDAPTQTCAATKPYHIVFVAPEKNRYCFARVKEKPRTPKKGGSAPCAFSRSMRTVKESQTAGIFERLKTHVYRERSIYRKKYRSPTRVLLCVTNADRLQKPMNSIDSSRRRSIKLQFPPAHKPC